MYKHPLLITCMYVHVILKVILYIGLITILGISSTYVDFIKMGLVKIHHSLMLPNMWYTSAWHSNNNMWISVLLFTEQVFVETAFTCMACCHLGFYFYVANRVGWAHLAKTVGIHWQMLYNLSAIISWNCFPRALGVNHAFTSLLPLLISLRV